MREEPEGSNEVDDASALADRWWRWPCLLTVIAVVGFIGAFASALSSCDDIDINFDFKGFEAGLGCQLWEEHRAGSDPVAAAADRMHALDYLRQAARTDKSLADALKYGEAGIDLWCAAHKAD